MTTKKLTWRQKYNNHMNGIKTTTFTNKYFITFPIYSKVPTVAKIEPKHIGKRLWVAETPQTEVVYLRKLNEDSVVVQFKGERIHRTLYRDEVMLHPDEWVIDNQTYQEQLSLKRQKRKVVKEKDKTTKTKKKKVTAKTKKKTTTTSNKK